MMVFPDIAKYDLKRVAFYTHVESGFAVLKKFWKANKKRCSDGRIMFFYETYKINERDHTAILNIRPSGPVCADIRILVLSQKPGPADMPRKRSGHRMTSELFIDMFRILTSRKKPKRPDPLWYEFSKEIKTGKPSLFDQGGRPLRITGIILTGEESSPIHEVSVREDVAGHVSVYVASKSLYDVEEGILNEQFFVKPMGHIALTIEQVVPRIIEMLGQGQKATATAGNP